MSLSDVMDDDLDLFFNPDDFAVEATLEDGSTINVIFDRPYEEALKIESNKPTVTAKASDVASLVHGDIMTLNDVDYVIINIQTDETGVAILYLARTDIEIITGETGEAIAGDK